MPNYILTHIREKSIADLVKFFSKHCFSVIFSSSHLTKAALEFIMEAEKDGGVL
jgi:hypothetical protein